MCTRDRKGFLPHLSLFIRISKETLIVYNPRYKLQPSAHEPTAKEAARNTDLTSGHANWMTSQNKFDDPIGCQQENN